MTDEASTLSIHDQAFIDTLKAEPTRVFSYEEIGAALWPDESIERDELISRIREVADDVRQRVHPDLYSAWGVGFRWESAESADARRREMSIERFGYNGEYA